MRTKVGRFLKFLSGVEKNGQIDRTALYTFSSVLLNLALLIFAYIQLSGLSETNSADFSHRIKIDLYTTENIRLITLFDDKVLIFKCDTDSDAWFELDTIKYNELPAGMKFEKVPLTYNVFKVDELLQDFEDLSFYEKKGQINFEYIYDQYAYYIEMLWENTQIKKYIQWQRCQSHFSNTYVNLENIYKRLKTRTNQEN